MAQAQADPVEASCHCGAVQIVTAYAPSDVNDCQCDHCQKRGVLWAYYSPRDVTVTGSNAFYVWGDKRIRFHFCAACGCTTHWTAADPNRDRMAINARLLERNVLAQATVRKSPGPK